MLDKTVSELLNSQINKELFSAYLYLDFSNYYYDEGLNGFGNWYKVQAQEERDHANLILQYMLNNGEKVVLESIAKPEQKLDTYRDGIAAAVEHERYITSQINEIYSAAMAVKDYRTVEFLAWFVKEQGEEEMNAEDQLKKFDLYGSDPRGLLMLDKDLETRVYSAPSLVL